MASSELAGLSQFQEDLDGMSRKPRPPARRSCWSKTSI